MIRKTVPRAHPRTEVARVNLLTGGGGAGEEGQQGGRDHNLVPRMRIWHFHSQPREAGALALSGSGAI